MADLPDDDTNSNKVDDDGDDGDDGDDEPNLENDAGEPKSRALMEWAEANSSRFGSQQYVTLANICGDIAKLERRYARVKERILEYDGEDASVLAPSDDNFDDDMHSDWSSSDDDDESVCRSMASSSPSTRAESIGNLIADKRKSDHAKSCSPSGLFMKYMGKYYVVPKNAIVQHMNAPPLQYAFKQSIVARTKRGNRSRSWNHTEISNRNIVIVLMQNRDGENSFYWCVKLELAHPEQQTQDNCILHLLPPAIVQRLHFEFSKDPLLKDSALVTELKPHYVKTGRRNLRYMYSTPLPGKARMHLDVFSHGTCSSIQVGNYWPVIKRKRKLESCIDSFQVN